MANNYEKIRWEAREEGEVEFEIEEGELSLAYLVGLLGDMFPGVDSSEIFAVPAREGWTKFRCDPSKIKVPH